MRPDGRSRPTVLATAIRSSARARSGFGTATLTCAPRYSTTEMLNTESRLLASGERGSGEPAGLQTRCASRRCSLSGRPLLRTAAMVRSLCSSGNGSKSSSACPARGRPSPSTRPDGRGSRPATASTAPRSRRKPPPVRSGIADFLGDARPPGLRAQRAAAPVAVPLDSRSVVVVDEASMVDTRRLVRLLEIAERAGAKVVLTGDDGNSPRSRRRRLWGPRRELGATRLGSNARQVAEWSAQRSMRSERAVPARRPRPTPITDGSIARPTRRADR